MLQRADAARREVAGGGRAKLSGVNVAVPAGEAELDEVELSALRGLVRLHASLAKELDAEIGIGDSVAVDGCCLRGFAVGEQRGAGLEVGFERSVPVDLVERSHRDEAGQVAPGAHSLEDRIVDDQKARDPDHRSEQAVESDGQKPGSGRRPMRQGGGPSREAVVATIFRSGPAARRLSVIMSGVN